MELAGEEKPKRRTGRRALAAAGFMALMAGLGASDSLRGIFAPVFQEHFSLNGQELAAVVMVSYMGNLVFLCAGGRLLDKCDKKKVLMAVIAVWLGAMALYLAADSYAGLLVGMFFTMGASTLLNTSVNLLTPLIFTAAPGMMVNIFFFVQGIGTSGSQNLGGRIVESYSSFQGMNVFLLILGLTAAALLAPVRIPAGARRKEEKAASYREAVSQNGFWLLVWIFGLYFVAEHGIMNWLVSYGVGALGMTSRAASVCLSGFYGGITAGRLLLAPAVSRAGGFRSVAWFGGAGAALFTAGILWGAKGLWLLAPAGLAVSIVYPTMVFLTRYVFPEKMLATGLGAVISAATLFDIGFNLLFGKMVDSVGYRSSFLVIPLCMAGFYLCYLRFYKKFQAAEGRGHGK